MIFEAWHSYVADLVLNSTDAEGGELQVPWLHLSCYLRHVYSDRDLSDSSYFCYAVAMCTLGIRALLCSASYLTLSCYPL